MWFQSGGNIIDHPVNGRVVTVDPRDLHGARKPAPASGGWQTYDVIRGAMRLMTPNVLVTDELVAERLAADSKPSGKGAALMPHGLRSESIQTFAAGAAAMKVRRWVPPFTSIG